MTTTIRLTRQTTDGNATALPGQVIEVSDATATAYLAQGWAEPANQDAPPKLKAGK